MRTKIQTALMYLLLLLAISCQKNDANSTRLNNVNNALPSEATLDTPGDENFVGLQTPVGTWKLRYSWDCINDPVYVGSVIMKVNADGTWSMPENGFTGHWVDGRGIFMFNFDFGKTVYSGTERVKIIKGIMTNWDKNSQGCFTMTPYSDGSVESDKSQSTLDPAGNM